MPGAFQMYQCVGLSVAAAIVASVFTLLLAVVFELALVLPHILAIGLDLALVGAHAAGIVCTEARIDALGIAEADIAPVAERTAIAEHDRGRHRAAAPFVAMPASVHIEHPLAMAHLPAIRPMIPGAADVDRIVIVAVVIGDVARAIGRNIAPTRN